MPGSNESANQPAAQPSTFTSRRRFIEVGIAAVGAAWGGMALQSALFPQAASQEAVPVSFPLAELPVGGTRQVSYGGTPVLVLRSPEGFKAFSLICTHLGCTVEWQAGKNEFRCPCHDGRFDQFGDAIAGPPTVPLESFVVAVQGDQVLVGS